MVFRITGSFQLSVPDWLPKASSVKCPSNLPNSHQGFIFRKKNFPVLPVQYGQWVLFGFIDFRCDLKLNSKRFQQRIQNISFLKGWTGRQFCRKCDRTLHLTSLDLCIKIVILKCLLFQSCLPLVIFANKKFVRLRSIPKGFPIFFYK